VSFFGRLRSASSLRPEKRSSALISAANSLSVIAAALKVIVLREYKVDLDAPPLTRADLQREVFEPMYPDGEKEAIREEIERLRAEELEQSSSATSDQPGSGQLGGLSLGMSRDTGELTREEQDFLAEIEDER